MRGSSGVLREAAYTFGFWLLALGTVALGAAGLVLGYWFSDLLYGGGLWPLGALLRIVLFLGAISLALRALYLIIVLFLLLGALLLGTAKTDEV